MKITGNKASDVKLAYIGGGSQGWAWKFMSDLAIEESLTGSVYLYDLNFEAAEINAKIGNKISSLKEAKSSWKYHAVKTIEESLKNADFVVISVLPGTFREMGSDISEPEKYGIYQPVGDTTGPGGLIRALRTIPLYADFADKIKKLCPAAWVLNYTNPMALCTRTLYEIFPEIKAFGCCHEVFGTQKILAESLEDQMGIKGISRNEISINVMGINHFTWISSASYKGIDLMPVYRNFAEKYHQTGYELKQLENWMSRDPVFRSRERIKFDLFKRYGAIAAAGDRHLAEFMYPWYLKNPETVKSWKFDLTPISYRIENKNKLNEKGKKMASGEEMPVINISGEEGVRQMKALCGLEDFVTNVNYPNMGQITGAPLKAVVETNAYFTRDSVRPVFAGALPPGIENLVMRHINNHETILKAALTKDKELSFKAFINDPLVNLDADKAKELFDKMLLNTKEYLPGWDI